MLCLSPPPISYAFNKKQWHLVCVIVLCCVYDEEEKGKRKMTRRKFLAFTRIHSNFIWELFVSYDDMSKKVSDVMRMCMCVQ